MFCLREHVASIADALLTFHPLGFRLFFRPHFYSAKLSIFGVTQRQSFSAEIRRSHRVSPKKNFGRVIYRQNHFKSFCHEIILRFLSYIPLYHTTNQMNSRS